ncbi:FecR family protein [Steroidobacter sp.]|uniref:FecR family protein n=1 Tax=Steroidobacter sp. TaxID=1978227 RepID=UPI001A58F171|nr:FecR domain-containing protein [Steroidobacter sp.]MBL8268919.1 FecR domain-containing protein [Steroidobacter sp.]
MESRQHSEQAAAAWIARRDSETWSDADAAALEQWLAESASHRVAYYRLNAAWQETGRLQALVGNTAVTPAPIASVPSVAAPPQRPQLADRQLRWRSLAAAIVLTVGASVVAFKALQLPQGTHVTVVGGMQHVPMNDGSRLTLNTNSQVEVAYSEAERRVEIKHGEAFFEVAKDSKRPFVVVAGDKRVIAVGTAFSVRREGDEMRLVVSEGTVRMETAAKNVPPPGPLKAGSIVRARRDDMLVQTEAPADIERTLSWRAGVLTFRDTPLANAVDEFNRYNTRKLVIEDERVGALQIGGIFRATQPEAFANLLSEGFPIQVAVEEERIVLRAN